MRRAFLLLLILLLCPFLLAADVGIINSGFVWDGIGIYTPSATALITAVGGITITHAHMHIEGDGSSVIVTANPQIAAGTDGQYAILMGVSDANTVTITNGTGLHLHGGSLTLGMHDIVTLLYHASTTEWEEISRNNPESEKSWAFRSQDAGSGTNYFAGFYLFNSGNSDFQAQQTLGAANIGYAAHVFLVLGENTEDDLTIRITGASITDAGVRTGADTEDLVFTHPALANAYVETEIKWLGQVTIDHISGTAKECNWGYAKYWDNNNNVFRVRGLDATWRGGAGDVDPDLQVIHHKTTGWTYNAGAKPTPTTAIASMKTDHTPDHQITNNVEGAWKRDNLNTAIDGENGEGIIIAMITNQNKTFESGNFLLRIRPD